ncbi:unnamed protein product [Adineta ricciae]|uniref:G-protein coupled receptors family 1 profile domain-containing protein n=1 Tax=Adineta ricciae TaxID=249248 RepID=A0A814ADH0_ADIRI|nr:unnamed protein product [Adineta ricciae]CAF0912837.1 unnamed protein product [Adineta ricciae]
MEVVTNFNNSISCNEPNDNTADQSFEKFIIPSAVQFWTFLIFEIPSLACTIFLLYNYLASSKLRNALHNHIVIILLIIVLCIEIFDDPLYIDAYRFGGGKNSFTMTPSICLMWWFIDYGFYGAMSVLLAWGSFERHILVFHHHQLLRTRKQRFLVHYLPLIIIITYTLVFYIIVIFFPPCENTFQFQWLGCGFSPCYEAVWYLNVWDYLGNGILCTFIETICSVTLLVRVLSKKRRLHRPMYWRKHRKMAIQILSISFLSLIIVFPQSLITVIQQIDEPRLGDFGAALNAYLFYLYSFVVFLLPFICLSNQSEIWKKLRRFYRKHRRVIGPATLDVARVRSIAIKALRNIQ